MAWLQGAMRLIRSAQIGLERVHVIPLWHRRDQEGGLCMPLYVRGVNSTLIVMSELCQRALYVRPLIVALIMMPSFASGKPAAQLAGLSNICTAKGRLVMHMSPVGGGCCWTKRSGSQADKGVLNSINSY